MGYTILIVDDSATMRALIRRVLLHSGLATPRILEADNGQHGLETAMAEQVDLILTDLRMPVMDGAEMAKKLKENESTRHIPVVVISSEPDLEVIEGLRQAGVRGCLSKPFTRVGLRRVVQEAMDASGDWVGVSPPEPAQGHPSGGSEATGRAGAGRAAGGMAIVQDVGSLLRESLITALETSAFVSPAPWKSGDRPLPAERPFVASVEFSGSAKGTVEVVADNEFCRLIAGSILRLETTGPIDSRKAEDALQELANIVCGVLLRVYHGCAEGVPRMGIPHLSLGESDEWTRLLVDHRAVVMEAEGRAVAIRYREAA